MGEQWVLSLRTYYARIQSPKTLELCDVWVVGEIFMDPDFSFASDFGTPFS